MYIFRRPDYQSEITQFIAKLKQDEPELGARQRQGLELLWDKSLDREALREFSQARVAQQPYVYQTDNE